MIHFIFIRIASILVNIYKRIKYKNIIIGYKTKILLQTKFGKFCKVGSFSAFGGEIGDNSYIGDNCNILAKIGKYCSIGDFVKTICGSHPTRKYVSTSPVFFSLKNQNGHTYVKKQKYIEKEIIENENVPVVIGNDVWVGSGTTFIGKIKVGDGAIIAANSTVINDVEAYSVVAGLPAREIRKRFSDENIEFLIKFPWWNKSEEWLRKNADKFEDIKVFITFIKQENIK